MENKPFKVIIDSNIWISFLIGKSLKDLQKYIDSQKVLIITCSEQTGPPRRDYFNPSNFIFTTNTTKGTLFLTTQSGEYWLPGVC